MLENHQPLPNESVLIKFKMISHNSLEIYRETSEKVLDDLKEFQKYEDDYYFDNKELDTLQYEIIIKWDKPFE